MGEDAAEARDPEPAELNPKPKTTPEIDALSPMMGLIRPFVPAPFQLKDAAAIGR